MIDFMWLSETAMRVRHGDKEPNLRGLKVGDWFLFCGWCGWQGKPNTVSNSKCPDCRKQLMECQVEQKDADEGKL